MFRLFMKILSYQLFLAGILKQEQDAIIRLVKQDRINITFISLLMLTFQKTSHFDSILN